MISADGVDLFDLVAERRGVVDEQLQKVVRRGFAGEELELAVDRARPGGNNAGCDLQMHERRASRTTPRDSR
jgi:hypothetical protein